MHKRDEDYSLRGTLDLTNVADLLQFLETSGRNGALGLSRGLGGKKARIFLTSGRVVHAASGELLGLDALAEVIGWESGEFHFAPDVEPPRVTLEMPLQFALLEAARIRDEARRLRDTIDRSPWRSSWEPHELAPGEVDLEVAVSPADAGAGEVGAVSAGDDVSTASVGEVTSTGDGGSRSREGRDETDPESDTDSERREAMPNHQVRNSSDVLEDLLKVPGVDAVVVVGRDGFVIESAGSSTRINIDALGAALAHSINGIEEMGSELRIDKFADLFVEYGRSVLLCRPVGEAIAVLVTPDASKLGIIRHKAKGLFQELGGLF